jgi:hypothetical protein
MIDTSLIEGSFCFCFVFSFVSISVEMLISFHISLVKIYNVLEITLLVCLFLRYLGLNSGPTPWVTPPVLFCDGFFWDRVS